MAVNERFSKIKGNNSQVKLTNQKKNEQA